jgi:hypothetical protein
VPHADFHHDRGIVHVRGAPCHPQTQGKIERWPHLRSLRSSASSSNRICRLGERCRYSGSSRRRSIAGMTGFDRGYRARLREAFGNTMSDEFVDVISRDRQDEYSRPAPMY